MEHSHLPIWKTPHFLWNQTAYYSVHMNLSQTQPLNNFNYLFKIHFNITLPLMPSSSK